MKKVLTALALMALVFQASAQEVVKKGINFGPLPAIGFSTDLGMQYGLLSDIFWYGDGSTYPDYIWKANVEVSRYTKGNAIYHAYFDSKYLIPGIRISADLTYLGNKTCGFYGFNGAAARYFENMDKIVGGQGLYLMRRDDFRVELTAQGKIGSGHWGWVGGLAYNMYNVDHAKNKGLSEDRGKDISLYDIYVANGIIPEAEKNGGSHLEFKAGVVYDTRDHENNPSRGSNLEVFFYGSPDILNGNRNGYRNDYLKLAIHFKQFFTLVQDRLVFGGHVAYQGLVAGNSPFYTLQTIMPVNRKKIITDGLGGYSTIRGVIINRLLGNGLAWGNFELRWNFARFKLFNQNFILATNPFFDLGMVVQPYRMAQLKTLAQDDTVVATLPDGGTLQAKDLFSGSSEKLHMGAGAGLHIIMNQNFNVSFELGKSLRKEDNKGLGISIGLNYIF